MTPSVIIIGAGPTGLILATELLRRGVGVRLVDKRATPSGATRAFTTHSRTMEMFEHMGVAGRMDEMRVLCPGNRYHFKGVDVPESEMPTLDFTRLRNTAFNYYGKVNQNDLEQVLRDNLSANYGLLPEWNVECTGVRQDREGVTVTLAHHHDGGREEEARHAWALGCDGAHSKVRAELGIAFKAESTYDLTMSMTDVDLEGYNGDASWVNYYVDATGFLLVTALPGDTHRLYLAGAMEKLLETLSPGEAYQQALDYFDTGARITDMTWSTTWVINKIIGETYQRGRILLCGDATHIHSPSSGQGMNACMQDAFNLGWKLAAVIRGWAPEDILRTYETERRPIAEQVTEGANRMHRILFDVTLPIEERYKLTQDETWHDQSINVISGLAHTYRAVTTLPDGVTPIAGPLQPGDRAPDARLLRSPPKWRLHDILRHTGFTLVLAPADADKQGPDCARLAQAVSSRFGPRVKAVAVAAAAVEGFDLDHMFVDRGGEFAQAYGQSEEGRVFLIRPDLVMAYQSTLSEGDGVLAAIAQWLK